MLIVDRAVFTGYICSLMILPFISVPKWVGSQYNGL